MVGTMALVVTLSVFNGFEQVVISLFSNFDASLKITPKEGKVFDATGLPSEKIKQLEGVVKYVEIVEENALLRYNDRQFLAQVKGFSENYQYHSPIDSAIIDGDLLLQDSIYDYAVLGAGVAYNLGLNLLDFEKAVLVYLPKRLGTLGVGLPDDSFISLPIRPAGVFSIQAEIDSKYMLVPVRFMRELLEMDSTQVTAIEIWLSQNANPGSVQKEVEQLCGPDFEVKNRFQQNEILYKTMKAEKLTIFLILIFILIVATFNMIGSLYVLILDKRKDIGILNSLGAGDTLIRKVFLIEGLLVSLSGAMFGLILGFLICWLQQTFGLIPLQGNGTFVMKYYPVKMELLDFILIFVTVFAIGSVAAWLPTRLVGILRKK